jgi:hypothetical protein
MNKAEKPQCLDVVSYPALRFFAEASEYQQTARRFGMKRILDVIKQSDVAKAQKEYALVANLKHDDKLWVAQIPMGNRVARAIFQVSEFSIPVGEKALEAVPADVRKQMDEMAQQSPVVAQELAQLRSGTYTAAHGQLRVKFTEPVVIANEKNPGEQATLDEVILSVHAASPGSTPDTYDPIKGFRNEYGTSLGIYSLSNKIHQAIERHVLAGRPPSLVRQYGVNLPAGQISGVIRNYFEKARSVLETVPYNTALRNCGSEIFESIDTITGFSSDKELPLAVFGRQYPKYAQYALLSRGLIRLHPGEKPDKFGGFTDSQIAESMRSLNQEVGMPEPR